MKIHRLQRNSQPQVSVFYNFANKTSCMDAVVYKKFSALKFSDKWSVVEDKDVEFYKLADQYYKEYHFRPAYVRPRENLLENVRFEFDKPPLDIYDLHKEFHIPTSYLISDKLATILREFKLQEHVIFPGIRYTVDGEERTDMHFLYFYNFLDELIDYPASTFWALNPRVLEDEYAGKKVQSEDIVEDNLKLDSLESKWFTTYILEDRSTMAEIALKNLKSPLISELAFFNLRLFNKGEYMSPELAAGIEENGITGIEYLQDGIFSVIRE